MSDGQPASLPWTAHAGGVDLHVRLTPRADQDRIDGIELRDDGRAVLKARVRALADAGKANAALIALLAKSLKTTKQSIQLVSGATARQKRLTITGDGPALAALLAALCDSSKTRDQK